MSGLEKIVSRLNEDTLRQCEEILASARQKAEAMVDAVQKEGNALIAEAEAEAEKKARAIASRAESRSQADGRKALLEAKVRLIDEVVSEAKMSLKNLSAENYFNALASLAVANKLEGTGEMRLSKADLQRMPTDFIDKLGLGIKVSPVPAEIEDGFILKYGDIEMNCTFDKLFQANKEELRLKASELLFG